MTSSPISLKINLGKNTKDDIIEQRHKDLEGLERIDKNKYQLLLIPNNEFESK